MIRNPNFQIRKRKWTTVLFLLRKRRRNNEEPHQNIKHRNISQNFDAIEGENSQSHTDVDVDVEADEGNENPRDIIDEKFEGFDLENPSLDQVVGIKEMKEEDEEEKLNSALIVYERKKDRRDAPPDDDCCPICFDSFEIPCKTNCGHWFCANCILQFWTYRTALQRCNCPICARPINNLTPEPSSLSMHEVEVSEVLKNVQRYNRLFQGGFSGATRKVIKVPYVFRRMISGLMDPDRFRGNYYAMRSFALLMSCIYNINSFDFIPTGRYGVRGTFDFCAIALVVILFLVGYCHRLVLKRRVRQLAANQI